MCIPVLAEKGLKWETIWSDIFITSLLRIESIHLAHCAKRCKTSCRGEPLRTRPAAAHCRRQRGSGHISLGRRIKGWDVTFARKRRDVTVSIRWESFNACFRWTSSSDDESCNRKGKLNEVRKLIELIIIVFEYWSHSYADWVPDNNHQLDNCLLALALCALVLVISI